MSTPNPAVSDVVTAQALRARLTLLDLIHAVQDEADDDCEVVATLKHLLDPASSSH